MELLSSSHVRCVMKSGHGWGEMLYKDGAVCNVHKTAIVAIVQQLGQPQLHYYASLSPPPTLVWYDFTHQMVLANRHDVFHK
jgi:hypothetical protein